MYQVVVTYANGQTDREIKASKESAIAFCNRLTDAGMDAHVTTIG